MTALSEFRSWRLGWTKPDRRPIYEWARTAIDLPPSFSQPGRFDVDRSRPLRWVFDAIQDDLTRAVRFRKPVRYGGTLVADIAIPWLCLNAPGPMMWVWPSDKDGKDHMKEKALPAWGACKPFQALLRNLGRHDKTITDIYFGPFFLTVVGANESSLQGKGIRYLFCDETWMATWQDMYAHAQGRTRDYERVGNSKIIETSQAGVKGDVEDRNFSAGNQGVWGYKGPDGIRRPLLFGGQRPDGSRWGLVFNDDAKKPDGSYNIQRACETARYVCKDTGHIWPDSPKTISEWNRDGDFIDQNPTAARHIRSYAVNALLNRSFASLIEEKLNALEYAKRGDIAPMRAYIQKAETRPYTEDHHTVTVISNKSGYTYQDYFNGATWDGEVDRFMAIDRQRGFQGDVPHWWVDARAFKANGDSRQLYFGRVQTIEAVRDIQLRLKIADRKTVQDAAFDTPNVYLDCAKYGWLGMFGSDERTWVHLVQRNAQTLKLKLPYSPIQRTRAPNGQPVLYMHFSSDYVKDILANLVGGRGAAWELPDDVSTDYVEHLKAEVKTEVRPGVFRWKKIHDHKDNHGWDTSGMIIVYALFTRRLGMPALSEPEPAGPSTTP